MFETQPKGWKGGGPSDMLCPGPSSTVWCFRVFSGLCQIRIIRVTPTMHTVFVHY